MVFLVFVAAVRLERIYRDKPADYAVPGIITLADSQYMNMLLIGGIISVAAFAALICLGIRRRKLSGESP